MFLNSLSLFRALAPRFSRSSNRVSPDAAVQRAAACVAEMLEQRVFLSATPTGLALAPGIGQISLSWAASAGATSYNIYRFNGTTYASLGSATTTGYTDTGLANDTDYKYEVTSVDTGGESAPSTPVDAYTPPAAPTGLSSTAGDTETFLNWSATTGADSYNIYRSIGGAPYVNVGSTAATEYVDLGVTDGTTYSYKISAVNSGGEGTLSSATSVTPAPADVDNLTATGVGVNEIDLSWELNTIGAENIEVDRSTDGSTWTAITTTLPGTTLSYAAASVSENTQYYYKVRAIHPDSSTSAFTNVADAYSLPAITDLAASAASASEIDLSWTTNITNATAIEVDSSPDGTTWTTLTSTLDPTATTYAHTALSESTQYYYRVHAITSGAMPPEATQGTTGRRWGIETLIPGSPGVGGRSDHHRPCNPQGLLRILAHHFFQCRVAQRSFQVNNQPGPLASAEGLSSGHRFSEARMALRSAVQRLKTGTP